MFGEQLFQIHVEKKSTLGGPVEFIAFGPAAPREFLDRLLVAINGQIALGNEKLIRNPHIVPVRSGRDDDAIFGRADVPQGKPAELMTGDEYHDNRHRFTRH